VIANGQNHPAFINGESCETFTLAGTDRRGTGSRRRITDPTRAIPGGGDGCYQIEGRLSPLDPASDRIPGIE
jgi:hypothetical protein